MGTRRAVLYIDREFLESILPDGETPQTVAGADRQLLATARAGAPRAPECRGVVPGPAAERCPTRRPSWIFPQAGPSPRRRRTRPAASVARPGNPQRVMPNRPCPHPQCARGDWSHHAALYGRTRHG
jgi:hypothetical protein